LIKTLKGIRPTVISTLTDEKKLAPARSGGFDRTDEKASAVSNARKLTPRARGSLVAADSLICQATFIRQRRRGISAPIGP
jgi:hypothetical protein